MYTHYFGIKEKPFSIAPDIRYHYESEQYREALAHLLYGINSDDCFILLTGDVGMGKTTVCKRLLEQFPEETEAVVVANPCSSVAELLCTICSELGIETAADTVDEKACQNALHVYLLEAHGRGRVVALIVDEAQNTNLDQLEQLCSLATFKSEGSQLLKIILIGQADLSQILNQQDASLISKSITSRYHLLALDQKNCSAYMEHRLAVAGAQEKIFSKAALIRVFQLSHGIPRFVDVLCDEALQISCMQKQYLVSAGDVDAASRNVLGNVVEKKVKITRKQLWIRVFSGLALFLLAGGALSMYFSQQYAIPSHPTKVEKPVVASSPVQVAPVNKQKAKKVPEQSGTTIHIVPLEIDD